MTPLQTYITKCEPREVTTREGRKFPLNEVYDASGQAWVAKKDVYDFAQRLIGQPVQMVTRTEQNGNFTNYYVDAIIPGAQMPMGQVTQQMPSQFSQPQYAHPLDNPAGVTQQEAIAMNAGWNPQAGQLPQLPQGMPYPPQERPLANPPPWLPNDKDLAIYRQTATKVAAWLSQGQSDPFVFWHMLPEIVGYFRSGNRPDWVIQREVSERLHPQGEQTAEDPASASAEAPPSTDDDGIPF
jgi:hypothetical protein